MTAESVDAYIATFTPEVQALLQQVRDTVRAAAPEADEVISYQIPAYKQHGILVYFGGFKGHIGFYPPVSGDAALVKSAAPYAGPKGNLQFPHAQPLPLELIARITRHRLQQNLAKVAAKKLKPARPARAT